MRIRTALIGIGLVASAFSFGTGGAADGVTKISMSNFRFCATAPCLPTDTAYLRDATTGPFGPDNSLAVVKVPLGATVTWVYADATGCDLVADCEGHRVVLEGEATPIGSAAARQATPQSFSHTFTAPGMVRYYCSIHTQLGMTGIIDVQNATS